jgi:hypothetical protein
MFRGRFRRPNSPLVRAPDAAHPKSDLRKELVMALLISVAPAEQGWSVRSEALEAELTFERGGRAEAAARDLASRLAASGHAAEVRVFLRDGAEAGRFLHPARAWAS